MAILQVPKLMCDCSHLYEGEKDHDAVETDEIHTSFGVFELEFCEHMLAFIEEHGRRVVPAKVVHPRARNARKGSTKRATKSATAAAKQRQGTRSPRKRRHINLPPSAADRGFSPILVREWCRENHIPVNAKGRIPQDALKQYEIAMTNGKSGPK